MKNNILIILLSTLFSIYTYAQDMQIKNTWQLLGATENLTTDTFTDSRIDYIWQYDTNDKYYPQWKVHIANGKEYKHAYNIISSFEKGKGFWIKGNDTFSIQINQTVSNYNNEINISEEWQLLGATEDINTSIFDNTCVDYIWKYDSSDINNVEWKLYITNDQNTTHSFNIITQLNQGDGFWVHSNNECLIDINSVNNEPTDVIIDIKDDLSCTEDVSGNWYYPPLFNDSGIEQNLKCKEYEYYDDGTISYVVEYSQAFKTDNGEWNTVEKNSTYYESSGEYDVTNYSDPLQDNNGYWSSSRISNISYNSDATIYSTSEYLPSQNDSGSWSSPQTKKTYYFENGTISSLYEYLPSKKDSGYWSYPQTKKTYYFENGTISSLYEYLPSKTDSGLWSSPQIRKTAYYDNGTVKYLYEYLPSKTDSGSWSSPQTEATTYNTDGNITSISVYLPSKTDSGSWSSPKIKTTGYNVDGIVSYLYEYLPSKTDSGYWSSPQTEATTYNTAGNITSISKYLPSKTDSGSWSSPLIEKIAYYENGIVSYIYEYMPYKTDTGYWSYTQIKKTLYNEDGTLSSLEVKNSDDIWVSADVNETFYLMKTEFEDVPFIMVNNQSNAYSAFHTDEDNVSINSVTHILEDGSKLSLSFDIKGYLLTASTDEVLYLFSNYTDTSVGVSVVDLNGSIVVEYATHQLSENMKLFIQNISSPTLLSKVLYKVEYNEYDNSIFTSALNYSSYGLTLLSNASDTIDTTGTFTVAQLGRNVLKEAAKTFLKSESDIIATTWDVVDILKDVAGCSTGSTVSCGSIVYTTVGNISTLYDMYQEYKLDQIRLDDMEAKALAFQQSLKDLAEEKRRQLEEDVILKEEADKHEVEDPFDNTKKPIANVQVSEQFVKLSTSVTFNASGSMNGDGIIISYVWSEGATVLSNSSSFSKSDFTEGTHTITLKVTDDNGLSDTHTITITILDTAPLADAGDDQEVLLDDIVTLDASNSTDSDGTIVSYKWSEGDTLLSASSSFLISDLTEGIHIITLEVTDNDDFIGTDTVVITVIGQHPLAKAGIDQDVMLYSLVRLDASSSSDSDGTIESYIWSEGSMILSTSSSFTKSDFSKGEHTITLKVTDNEGFTGTDTVVITVGSNEGIPCKLSYSLSNGYQKYIFDSDVEEIRSLTCKIRSYDGEIIEWSQPLQNTDGTWTTVSYKRTRFYEDNVSVQSIDTYGEPLIDSYGIWYSALFKYTSYYADGSDGTIIEYSEPLKNYNGNWTSEVTKSVSYNEDGTPSSIKIYSNPVKDDDGDWRTVDLNTTLYNVVDLDNPSFSKDIEIKEYSVPYKDADGVWRSHLLKETSIYTENGTKIVTTYSEPFQNIDSNWESHRLQLLSYDASGDIIYNYVYTEPYLNADGHWHTSELKMETFLSDNRPYNIKTYSLPLKDSYGNFDTYLLEEMRYNDDGTASLYNSYDVLKDGNGNWHNLYARSVEYIDGTKAIERIYATPQWNTTYDVWETSLESTTYYNSDGTTHLSYVTRY